MNIRPVFKLSGLYLIIIVGLMVTFGACSGAKKSSVEGVSEVTIKVHDESTGDTKLPKPEYRALWITRFEWPAANEQMTRQKIVKIFDDMKAANFNTAVFQIRGSAETLYPSKLEPWSKRFDYKNPGFDPVAFAIEEAHKRGIEFHAYINPMPMAMIREDSPIPDDLSPPHIFTQHGPDSDEPWVAMNKNGEMLSADKGGYHYFSAGIPEVQTYLRNVIMDVVKRYDVDGIHLDRIRYSGPQYSYDPVSMERFYGRGNPNRLEWGDWTREQIDKFINDLGAEIRSEKPFVIFSAAVWGIYNRYYIDGYDKFSSGYHDYYQDSFKWIKLGAMDLLFPMIYWNIPDPKPNYDELFDDFVKRVGIDHVVGGQRAYGNNWDFQENIDEIKYTREAGGIGTCLFAYGGVTSKNGFKLMKESLYKTPVGTPRLEFKEHPKVGTILGRVIDENGNPVRDAWVSIGTATEDKELPLKRARDSALNVVWPSGSDGRFAFNNVPILPSGKVNVTVEYDSVGVFTKENVEVAAGKVSKVDVTISGLGDKKDEIYCRILSPKDDSSTTNEVTHILGRTNPTNMIEINGKIVDVYGTGAFALDNVKLEPGENLISIKVFDPDGNSTERILKITRKEKAGKDVSKQEETSEDNFESFDEPRVVETIEDAAGIMHGLHSVRLGGPYLAEVPLGTQLVAVGRKGGMIRVELASDTVGWMSADDLKFLDEDTPAPKAWFLHSLIGGEDPYDVVSVGLNAPVVVTAKCETYPRNMIYLDFYNSHWASTWNSHKSGAKVIGPVEGRQVADGHVRMNIPVNTKQIWGFWLEHDGNIVKLYVKRPPNFSNNPDTPLEGLYIAVEAGHGGSNSGAIGTMGTLEKTVNREATDALTRELERLGAEVIQTRIGDESVSLARRTQRAIDVEADLFISMHSNSAGTSRGFKRVSGTSTYYKHAQSQLIAAYVYEELLKLGWGEFGVVGNFNYYPLRMTHMPAFLVEQAFMSNPYDEARLIDPEYQNAQANAIARGVVRFLNAVKE